MRFLTLLNHGHLDPYRRRLTVADVRSNAGWITLGAVLCVLASSTLAAEQAKRRHPPVITSLAFSPNGKLLAWGTKHATVVIWDVNAERPVGRLDGHSNPVRRVAFSPNGEKLVAVAADTTKVWDVHTDKETVLMHLNEGAQCIAFSPDGEFLCSGGGRGTVKLWNVTTGAQRAAFVSHSEAVISVAFSPDGTKLASASLDGTVKLWDVASGHFEDKLRKRNGSFTSVAFGEGGETLAATCISGGGHLSFSPVRTSVLMHELESGKTHGVNLRHAAVEGSPTSDGKLLALRTHRGVILWDVRRMRERRFIKLDYVEAVAVSPDGSAFATVTRFDPLRIRLWDSATGTVQKTFR